MLNSEISDKLVRITPAFAPLAPSQDTTSDQLAFFHQSVPIPFVRHSPLPVPAQSTSGAAGKSIAQTQAQRIVRGTTTNLNQIPVSSLNAGTQNNVNLSSAALSGSLGALKINLNVMSNFTNNATVDSIDNGVNATVRVYGPGGVGTTWHQVISSQTSQEYPSGSITGAYTTKFFVTFNPLTGLFALNTTGFAALPDGLIYAGTVTTVASGGGGGTGGGGGSSGGGGGRQFF